MLVAGTPGARASPAASQAEHSWELEPCLELGPWIWAVGSQVPSPSVCRCLPLFPVSVMLWISRPSHVFCTVRDSKCPIVKAVMFKGGRLAQGHLHGSSRAPPFLIAQEATGDGFSSWVLSPMWETH